MLTIDDAVQLIIKKKKELKEEMKLEEIKKDFEDEEDTGDFTTTLDFKSEMKLATYITRMKKDIDPNALSYELYKYWNNDQLNNKYKELTERERALWDLCNVVSTMNIKIQHIISYIQRGPVIGPSF